MQALIEHFCMCEEGFGKKSELLALFCKILQTPMKRPKIRASSDKIRVVVNPDYKDYSY